MSSLSDKQLKKINQALSDAHDLFASMDGYPKINITRVGRELSAGQPEIGIDPTSENLSLTNVSAEFGEVQIDEIAASIGAVQFGDRRVITRTPLYTTDIIKHTEVVGIEQHPSNVGTGNLLSIISYATAPSTDWLITFSSSVNFSLTNAAGSAGIGNVNATFTSTASDISILSTSWFGTFALGDKIRFRTEYSEYNVYRVENITAFGDYQSLVRKVQ